MSSSMPPPWAGSSFQGGGRARAASGRRWIQGGRCGPGILRVQVYEVSGSRCPSDGYEMESEGDSAWRAPSAGRSRPKWRPGLVHDQAFAGFKSLPCDLEVGCVGRGHDDEAERGVGEHCLQGAVGGDAGIALGGVVGGALEDGGQFQALDRGDQRGVEDAPRCRSRTNLLESCITSGWLLSRLLISLRVYTGSRQGGRAGARRGGSW